MDPKALAPTITSPPRGRGDSRGQISHQKSLLILKDPCQISHITHYADKLFCCLFCTTCHYLSVFHLNSWLHVTGLGWFSSWIWALKYIECQHMASLVMLDVSLRLFYLRWFIDIPQVWMSFLVGHPWLTTDKLSPYWQNYPPYGSSSIIGFWCTNVHYGSENCTSVISFLSSLYGVTGIRFIESSLPHQLCTALWIRNNNQVVSLLFSQKDFPFPWLSPLLYN